MPLLLTAGCQRATAQAPKAETWTLPNSIRLVSVFFPQSTNAAIFTYVPMGLATDGSQQVQWSHVVEHLVIRSTIPKDLSEANAETLPDHMRLDTYGNIGNWKTGLLHHRGWLVGVPFTQANLETEIPKIRAEADYTVKNFATHKFALAAWAQAFRHGRTNVAIQPDSRQISLREIQSYRDKHLPIQSNIVVCIVGGIEPARALTVASNELAPLQLRPASAVQVQSHPGDRKIDWDLDARHLVLTWPIPAPETEEFAPLFAGAQWLNMQFFADSELKEKTGMILAGGDLATPEGQFFYISASLRPGSSFEEVQERVDRSVQKLSASNTDLALLPMLGKQMAESLTKLPDPVLLKGQLPPTITPAMLEMNVGLQWGMNEFRYGPHSAPLAKRLAAIKPAQVREAATKHLAEASRSVFTLE